MANKKKVKAGKAKAKAKVAQQQAAQDKKKPVKRK